MADPAARIRWQDPDSPGNHPFIGHVTGIDDVFRIHPPEEPGDEWQLTTWLPGMAEREFYSSLDNLKIQAERWLEEFIASLGAVFANAFREKVAAERARKIEAARNAPSYELQNRYWGRLDALDWVLTLLDPEASAAERGPGQ